MDRITLAGLAKELGVTQTAIFTVAQELQIRAKKMAATVNNGDADRLRRHFGRPPLTAPAGPRTASTRARGRGADKSKYLQATQPAAAATTTVKVPPTVKPQPEICRCCGVRLKQHGPTPAGEPRCPACVAHYPPANETPQHQLARLAEHEERFRTELLAAQQGWVSEQENARNAYRSRNSWRAALTRVLLLHEDDGNGHCRRCHSVAFPCRTWLDLGEANRGINVQVERYASLSDEELDRQLADDEFYN